MPVSKTVKNGHSVVFKNNCVEIKIKKNCALLKEFKNNGLILYKSMQSKCYNTTKDALNNAIKWHNRFGHVNFNCLKDMSIKRTAFGLKFGKIVPEFACETCAKNKTSVKPFPQASETRAKSLLEIVHSDICGPINCVFIDDMSRHRTVYFLKRKDTVFDAFKNYKAMSKKQTGCIIKHCKKQQRA